MPKLERFFRTRLLNIDHIALSDPCWQASADNVLRALSARPRQRVI